MDRHLTHDTARIVRFSVGIVNAANIGHFQRRATPGDVWKSLDDDKRLAYDEERLAHHSRLLIVETPVISKVITEGRRLSYLNRSAVSGRCGLILSGPAGLLTELARGW